jgi:hypothetical protein
VSRRKWIAIAGLALGLPYLALGTLVVLRSSHWADPCRAARDFLDALRKRDAVGIYLYADMLGPRLSGMMEKSNLSSDEKKNLWAKDFGRWREEFEKGSKSMDSLRLERALLPGCIPTTIGPRFAAVKISTWSLTKTCRESSTIATSGLSFPPPNEPLRSSCFRTF